MNKYAAILALLTFILSGGYGLYEHSTYTRIKSELDQVDCGRVLPHFHGRLS